jgi:EAL domain-containing protein (putative c-di-GMP-specific phosphodiesterase class I)/CheY-like chemotaxis protein
MSPKFAVDVFFAKGGSSRVRGPGGAAVRKAKNRAALKEPAETVAGRRTVLLVDDNAKLARAMSRILEAAGYAATTANDGSVAVALLRHHSFDVIVSDIQMRGMTGVELLRNVRASDLDVPVILITSDPSVEAAMKAVSLGALQYLPRPATNEILVKAVERASRLHQIARMKREALRLGREHHALAGDRAGLEARFECALETMWIAVQPIVDAARQRVFGYEALMRADEPSLPNPGAILDAAERLDRVQELGRRVRFLAAEAFQDAPSGTVLFVNLHTQDLLDPLLYESSSPLAALSQRVVLEITERSAIDDVKDIQSRVSILRKRGFRIAIDDLGAGYAGLASFIALEPEIVKLDMSLIRGVHQSSIRQRIVGSMAALCKEMGMRVIAEGVELPEEHDCVRASGCDLQQGYLFARPGPPFPAVAAFS